MPGRSRTQDSRKSTHTPCRTSCGEAGALPSSAGFSLCPTAALWASDEPADCFLSLGLHLQNKEWDQRMTRALSAPPRPFLPFFRKVVSGKSGLGPGNNWKEMWLLLALLGTFQGTPALSLEASEEMEQGMASKVEEGGRDVRGRHQKGASG